MTPSSGETSQTLDRALRFLALLADPSGGRSVTELAARLGVSRPALYRLLTTLEHHAMVDRAPDGQVRLGLGLLALARAVTPRLGDAALPVLRRLADETGATAHLTVAEPGGAVAVAVVEPAHTPMHVAYRVGTRHPLDRGAAGRAILAGRGGGGGSFVVTEGELQPGAVGIAAPVIGVAGLEASVGLIALGPLAGDWGPRVVRAAAAVAAALS
jgi:DNA-binding IclR family transcriptional regulator